MRSIVGLAVASSLALSALLQARGVTALASAALVTAGEASPGRAVLGDAAPSALRAATTILARNAFDHATGPLLERDEARASEDRGAEVLPCPTVRALFTVRGEDEEGSLAALEVAGARLVRAPGGEVPGGMHVVHVGFDRVWLAAGESERDACVAPVFQTSSAPSPPPTRPPASPPASVDPRIAKGVVRVSETETHVDRGALPALEEALSSGKLRAVPERDARGRLAGLRLGAVAPGSVPALFGLASGDRLEAIAGVELDDTSALLEGWARLRGVGEGRIPLRIVRGGRTLQLDVLVK